ncbi:MAG: hypothetical protein IOD12_03895 [Silvanigrellales bacterium]|jgi:predicted solute-binding protein|nr:hypothetical protein [Silvanigrellales bacterium]
MTDARLGAVAYLNMLPFFHQGNITVFKTPRALNDAARRGDVDAACMSAIAGLRAGFRPLFPAFGIGAAGPVRSVFVEPVPFSAAEDGFWRNWERGLPSREEVVLWTSGASEHSEWLASTLLETAGARVEVIVDAELEKLSAEALRARLERHRRGRPAAALFIGDPALVRAHSEPATFRVDLASAWQAFSGLPCVFAAWFNCRAPGANDASADQSAEVHVATLSAALESWEALGSRGRRDAIARFFQSASGALLNSDLVTSLETYVEGISFAFGDGFLRTLAEYEKILSAQGKRKDLLGGVSKGVALS